ncbi:uncharacterized protein LOC118749801 [Rhagoletis pomonella]|uniref:uncharacterized protein LOC118749801 n=1 Tax=Rhagoletis pomonella TaxID=28610 RepID=UPI00177A81E5|nr:uncharacterized protein LOC118749801 [Rhagoletis pomonella]
MNQAEIRAQKQREQNERRLSVQRNNAYFSIRSQSDSESAKPNPSNTLKPPQDSSQRTCPRNLPSTTSMSWSEECAPPRPYHISRPTLTSNSVTDNISPNIDATTTSTVTSFTTSIAPITTNTPVHAGCTAMSTAEQVKIYLNLSTYTGNKGKAQEKLKNETTKNAAIHTGMNRYVTIKRKFSPQNSTGSLQIVIKGIEPSVEAVEALEALKGQGFNSKAAVNIFNRNKIPQPMFKVELEPENKPLGKKRCASNL